MKKISLLILIVFALVTLPAVSQFRAGVKLGTNVSSLKLNNKLLSSSNTAGFTGGVMIEYITPVLGVGFDASVMYARKGASLDLSFTDEIGNLKNGSGTTKLDYITVPINLKYKLPIPMITPFVTVGPDFSFLVGDTKGLLQNMDAKKVDVGINLGFGVEFLKKLQLAAQYGWGVTNAIDTKISALNKSIDAKNRYWTITAAWLF